MPISVAHVMSYDLPDDGVSKWSTPCESCKFALPPLKDIAAEYFDTGGVVCQKCGASSDIWRSMLASTKSLTYGVTDLVGFGALNTTFRFPLTKGQLYDLHFPTLGIPENAVILHVGCTANGGPAINCLPVEVSMSFWVPRFSGNKVQIYGFPTVNGEDDIEVWGSVTWVHNDNNSEPWRLFAEAFEAILANKPSRVLTPAHSAFEISLSQLIKEVLELYSSKDKVKGFMVRNLTADASLNILLPFVCAHLGINRLPVDIAGRINRLRNLRNDFVHEGLTDDQLQMGEIKELLCAAVFGFEFVRFA